MSNPIYPAIVPGLRVRHRETLEESTVAEVGTGLAFFENDSRINLAYFWERFEPLPQPGDRVRVVRSAQRHTDCIGSKGELIHSIGGVYAVLSGHNGPLSDFEVILPEESETDMTDIETVAVPVELARKIHDYLDDETLRIALEAVLPKPKPRLVAVSPEVWHEGDDNDWYDAQPDLLETLDGVIDEVVRQELSDYGSAKYKVGDHFKTAYRKALGVSDGN